MAFLKLSDHLSEDATPEWRLRCQIIDTLGPIPKSQWPSGTYVYTHRRVTDGAVYYVGKGRKGRAWESENRNDGWHIQSSNYGRIVSIFETDSPDYYEALTIRLHIARGAPLVNIGIAQRVRKQLGMKKYRKPVMVRYHPLTGKPL